MNKNQIQHNRIEMNIAKNPKTDSESSDYEKKFIMFLMN